MSDSAVLLIDCPDRKGLVARVSGLLYEHGANILHADQHQDHDLGLFFMRVEWALDGSCADGSSAQSAESLFDLDAFKAAFTPLAAELGMNRSSVFGMAVTRLLGASCCAAKARFPTVTVSGCAPVAPTSP